MDWTQGEVVLQAVSNWIWDAANTQFASAIISSFSGAIAGAMAAFLIAARGKQRDALLAEVRATNRALMIAFNLCDAALRLKKQHVKLLKDTYELDRKAFKDFHDRRSSASVDSFHFDADFRTFTPISPDVQSLQQIAFEKISLNGRPLGLVMTLAETFPLLSDAIQKRNDLIAGYQSKPLSSQDLVAKYFGLPVGGHIDQNYPDTVDLIASYADDCIFFSSLLCTDLHDHGEKMRTRFIRKFGRSAPKINEVSFSDAQRAGLIPDAEGYVDWTKGFVKRK